MFVLSTIKNDLNSTDFVFQVRHKGQARIFTMLSTSNAKHSLRQMKNKHARNNRGQAHRKILSANAAKFFNYFFLKNILTGTPLKSKAERN